MSGEKTEKNVMSCELSRLEKPRLGILIDLEPDGRVALTSMCETTAIRVSLPDMAVDKLVKDIEAVRRQAKPGGHGHA